MFDFVVVALWDGLECCFVVCCVFCEDGYAVCDCDYDDECCGDHRCFVGAAVYKSDFFCGFCGL